MKMKNEINIEKNMVGKILYFILIKILIIMHIGKVKNNLLEMIS